jgi:hypothetical protein
MYNYYELFYIAFKRWVELIRRKVDIKIDRCFDNEKVKEKKKKKRKERIK